MTIAAGFICDGGIVIGTDSEFNSPILKFGESKISILIDHGDSNTTQVVLTGAGDWSYIAMAIEKITARWREGQAQQTIEEFKELVENTVLEIYEKHIPLYPAEGRPSFSLLLAVKPAVGYPIFIRAEETAVFSRHDFAIIGSGETLGRYLADTLYKDKGFDLLSLREGAILTAYILWSAKRFAPGCGGTSTICSMSHGHFFSLGGIHALEERFDKWESLIRPLFFAALNTHVSPEDFEEKLASFRKEIGDLRVEWEAVQILEPEMITTKPLA